MEKTFINHLAEESSPYLLQHAHNPVEWYPWGEEALTRAKEEDKPILVSIGYAACHWCHVMERESFEDERTAEIMNRYFINIKIDREERPDLDHIYMDAVQAISGSGGWPLNVFLTPEKKPFYGGTYYPPIQAYNRSSWKGVLMNVQQLFTEKRHEVEAQAENLTNHLVESSSFGINNKLTEENSAFPKENLQLIADNILKQADKIEGGFGKAPKFPQTFSIQYLLRHYHFTKDKKALQQALLSLDKMIYGGIYDQLGGGFARYSTDAEWLAPHFEKMLYDNALLINVLAEAYQVTNNPLYANTIEHTLAFIEREMQSEEKGFYSALDADSEGTEGKFYVWSKQEIDEILGEESNLFCTYYDITEEGNWEHTNILRVLKPLEVFALDHNYQEATLEARLNRAKDLLMKQRNNRVRPQLDDKILLGWNALMVTAYCKAYAATGKKQYKATAEAVFSFLETNFGKKDGSFLHTYKDGEAKIAAFLDDYAYLIQSSIALQEITGKAQYLDKAKKIAEYVIQYFSEDSSGLFYFTGEQQTDVIVRKKEVYDGAVPSGNAIMIGNLHYLSIIYQEAHWRHRVESAIRSLLKVIVIHPTSFAVWACVLQSLTFGTKEIVLTGVYILKELPKMLKKYVPNKILQIAIKEMENYPLLAGKLVEEVTICYLCENETCQETIFSVDDFLKIF